jgi:glycosyltransferase involved in cell wall biosynthesis
VIVGIDASNVRTGGGVTHLMNLLREARPGEFGIERAVLWAGRATLDELPDAPWLEKVHEPMLDRALPFRLWWQWFVLPRRVLGLDLLFAPGGNAPASATPTLTMSRNMLPFEWRELSRYGVSWVGLRLLLLRLGQARTLARASGVIFLTEYARSAVGRAVSMRGEVVVIPHGVEERFREAPRPQRRLSDCSFERPLRLLYVSIVDLYKHQWHVAEAVAALRAEGLPLSIDFVGPSYPPALRRLRAALAKLDPAGEFLRYRGPMAYGDLHTLRSESDLFVFASSCENMPNILLEAMAAGFPIACARRGPMPEILGDGGEYFDPERPDEIARAVRTLAEDAERRAQCARIAFARAAEFSWRRCARETLAFMRTLHEVSDAD